MTDSAFEFYLADVDKPFSGWDFSYITVTERMNVAPLPWSYTSLVLRQFRSSESVLDMGTGGGEFLETLKPFPKKLAATEGYLPNLPIAKARLEPQGVTVKGFEDDHALPFKKEEFQFVINKHDSYSPTEVNRILTSNGSFITQQVGGEDMKELNRILDAPLKSEYDHWNLKYAVLELETAGFRIVEAKEAFPSTRFYDIGAIIYYLKAIPWQIPDFSPNLYHTALYRLHKTIEKNGYIDIPSHRFLIHATKAD
ncbi:class I SAM-dependent methyltransferase [Guptibacillus spartinae]|uniref:class I SAM-dependent methyltransferase n=1 Tax=Guptibacillus spartinae TaxID=3025679 RepID=UPI002362C5B8|nr:SAM-dependent methyltransferase [Pseudalkalibacillus spartinae]